MPFTLSHAAAALPFRKFKPIWPALVIGTFAPDLQYFIWVSEEDRSGHHFPEVLYVTLPLALMVLWAFEWFVKGPAAELLPSSLQRRVQDKLKPLSFWGWKQFATIVLWVAVGIATHIFWDEFTHPYAWLAGRWGLLRIEVPVPLLHPMRVAKILQSASSILGLLAVCVWLADWYRRAVPVSRFQMQEFSPPAKATVALTIVAIAVLAGYPYAMFTLAGHGPPFTLPYVAATVFEAVTLVFCSEMLLYGLAVNVVAAVGRVPAAPQDETAR